MTAELQSSEPGTQGMRRIARAQIKNAVEALGGRVISDKRVHEARKELKRLARHCACCDLYLGAPYTLARTPHCVMPHVLCPGFGMVRCCWTAWIW